MGEEMITFDQPVIENWKGDQYVQALRDAFHESQDVLERRFAREFVRHQWEWPTDPSPRDIDDTGTLRRSQRKTQVSETQYRWSWHTDYALFVHNGVTFKRGPLAGRSFPARPWTLKPIEELPKIYETLARRNIQRMANDGT